MTWSLELPDGRTLGLAQEVRDRLSCGVVALDPVSVFDNPAVGDETRELGAVLAAEHTGRKPSEIPGLAEARTLYKSFGADPSRHRPSSEALLRRILKGQDLYRINNAVDACNLASLKFLLPIGMYDLDQVQGNVELRVGLEGEEYPGIRKGPVHLAGRLGLFDRTGPFGSPTSDSARTSVTENTERILAVVMATQAYPAADMAANLDFFAGLFVRHCQGVEIARAALGADAAARGGS